MGNSTSLATCNLCSRNIQCLICSNCKANICESCWPQASYEKKKRPNSICSRFCRYDTENDRFVCNSALCGNSLCSKSCLQTHRELCGQRF